VNRGNGDAARREGVESRRRVFVAKSAVIPLLLLLMGVGSDSRADSWYEGRLLPLVYHGRPLPEVIEDVQRYVHRRIRVDAVAAGFLYSGIVKLEDVDAWLRDLPTIYPLEIVDCHTSGLQHDISACADPQLLLIRSRLDLHQNGMRPTPL
jgi:ferric-dicitrate binding protein FerR (iron transport regulator)